MKTPPHLYTMPSTASVISLPSWEQPLLIHGWENSSKEDGRSHSQKLHRLIVQRLSVLASPSKQEHMSFMINKNLSKTETQKGYFFSLLVFPIFFTSFSVRSYFVFLKFNFNLLFYSLDQFLF